MSKAIQTNRGFSLVEIIVALGLLSGLSVIVMNLQKQSTASSAKYQLDSDVTLTSNEINAILSDPIKCLAVFGTTGTPDSINGKYYIATHASAPAQGYGNSGLQIESYNLSAAGNEGVLAIQYKNKNILKRMTGPGTIAKKINLYVEGTVGAITKCRALSTSTTDIWTHGTGANQHDIFYIDGNVGVGISTPQAKLDVDGGIHPGHSGVATGSSCAPNPEGTFAYDLAAHAPVYCNQLALWATMGGTPAPVIAPERVHGVNDGGAGFDDSCPIGYSVTGVGVGGNAMRLRCTKFQ